jgi:hypothetical protein
MKRAILMLTVVSLLVAIPVLARNNVPGDVSVPTDLTLTSIDPGDPPDTPATVTFDWLAGDDAKPAEKYSLDIYGMIVFDYVDDKGTPETDDDELIEDVEIEWSASFGTGDYNPDNMSDPTITIPLEDVHVAIFADILETLIEMEIDVLAVDGESVEITEMFAKVKGLDPSDKNPKKRQNNTFSESIDLMPHPEIVVD